jgi:bacteriorhodopsin
METLTSGQYELVANLLSLTVAGMGAATLFFFLSRAQVAVQYRTALTVSGLVTAIACYHYFRIYESWKGAYVLQGGAYTPSGLPFNDAYRYADWLLTVPLLLVELVAVLALSAAVARPLLTRLVVAAVLMIGLGYPGEVASATPTRLLWWSLSMLPFLYIMYVLWAQLSRSLDRQPDAVKALVSRARLLILLSWSFYPIAFLAPDLGFGGSTAEVLLQVGYTVADLVAKVGLGLYVFGIARAKSDAEGFAPAPARPATA